MKFASSLLALSCCLFLTSSRAQATVVVGGISFDDNAFADKLVSSSGGWTYGGGATSLEDALVGSNPNDYAFAFGRTDNVVLSFTDNVVVNGAGEDLAVFDLGTIEFFSLVINGVSNKYTFVSTGTSAGGFALNVARIDLSDFGVAAGASIDTIQLFPAPDGTDPADFTVIGALNSGPAASVPEPATFGMACAAAGMGLLAVRRGRKSSSR